MENFDDDDFFDEDNNESSSDLNYQDDNDTDEVDYQDESFEYQDSSIHDNSSYQSNNKYHNDESKKDHEQKKDNQKEDNLPSSKQNNNDNNASGLNNNINKPNSSLTPKGNDALDKNKKNRFKNTLNNIKNGKNKNKSEDNSEDNSEDKESNNSDNLSENTSDEKLPLSKRIKRKLILLGLAGAGIIVGIMLFLIVLQAIVGVFGIQISFYSAQTYGGSDYEGVTEEGTELSINEKKYYAKLEEAANSYKESCNLIIDKNYIHSVLVYKYIGDPSSMFDTNMESSEDAVDYDTLFGKVDSVLKMIVDNCTADYEINGRFYNKLKESTFFKDYYKDLLKEKTSDEILNEIFEIADSAGELYVEEKETIYVSPNLKIDIVGNGVYESVNIKEYIKGAIYAHFSSYDIINNNKEFLKSYAIAKLTDTLSSDYNPNNASIRVNSREAYCNINKGCYKGSNNAYVTGGTTNSSGGGYFINDLYYYKEPLDSSKTSILNSVVEEVFGIVMKSTENNSIKSIDINKLINIPGSSYQEILMSSYDNFKLKSIIEDDYTSEVKFEKTEILSDVIFYDQNNYSNVTFCGRKSATIKSSGCGVTAMAIIASTFKDKSYDPVSMMNLAYSGGYCGTGISGTATSFFKYASLKLGLGYQNANKYQDGLSRVVSALSSGKSLVVALMGSGTFTNGGHYIVLSGIRANTKEVYVNDPNQIRNIQNRNIRNGWYSLNDVIAKEARSFYIITKG